MAERLTPARVFHALLNAIYRRSERARGLPDPVLMHKALRQRQPAADLAKQRVLGHEHVLEADAGMIGRHVEGPHIFLDLYAGALGRYQEAGDAPRIAVIAAGAREQRAVR